MCKAWSLLTRVSTTENHPIIGDLLKRKPRELSGGQRQRVALGRALARNPKVFLFDEPLSNLDAALRIQLRREIKGIHQKLGVTMIYVTHDQTEAMALGLRIAVMVLLGIIFSISGTPMTDLRESFAFTLSRAPASSMTSMALSGRKRSVM